MRTAVEFCDEVRGRLVGSLTIYCGDRGVAEEVAQDALVRAWERWGTVGAMASPEAWTYRTAFNLATSWHRRRSAERRARRRLAARPDPATLAPSEVDHELRAAVVALPPRQRAVVTCRFYLDLSVEDTAALLECAPGTVKAATSHALAALRASGAGQEHDEDGEATHEEVRP